MQTLALIDDDVEIRQLLSQYLNQQGFEVQTFADGESFLQADMSSFELAVLDLGLPGMDGLDVCRNLRQTSSLPVIMLTAASDDLDRILGLELGADDYVGKPFNPRELLARIKALLRRVQVMVAPASEDAPKLQIDTLTRSVSFAGTPLALTGAEFDLLNLLYQHHGEVLSRDAICQVLHGRNAQPFDRSIDTSISRLRNKLNIVAQDSIQSVRGKGYVLVLA
ncbi:MAG: response regulator transcription factor [Oceanospirillaceae bacterium]|jgi:DNA-binding response OmpR family regulator|nr:response regulator transcription factor [Oceanospirillaceae bacterium]MBT4441830.1 response regulator transcription factor [Oceanospirillaceae bacterium]MBT6076950.1 response regulator transcription factor [Oceanospirillaceae bacterium]MBT7330792.1 response regulator transcription factor [Oceanospirillaceae bacterium]